MQHQIQNNCLNKMIRHELIFELFTACFLHGKVVHTDQIFT